MRTPSFLIVMVACGPAQKPAVQSPVAETSVEKSEAQDAPTNPPADSTPKQADSAPGSRPLVAHCLIVGPEERVVRCYWNRPDCEAQIKFNASANMTAAQECRGVAEAHCTQASDGELCFPTGRDCDQMVANMRKRDRKSSDCVVKTKP